MVLLQCCHRINLIRLLIVVRLHELSLSDHESGLFALKGYHGHMRQICIQNHLLYSATPICLNQLTSFYQTIGPLPCLLLGGEGRLRFF